MYVIFMISLFGRDCVVVILFQLYGTKAGLFRVIGRTQHWKKNYSNINRTEGYTEDTILETSNKSV